MNNLSGKYRVGILPGIAELYNRIWPEIQHKLNELIESIVRQLQSKELEVFLCNPVSTVETTEAGCRQLEDKNIDLLIVALAPYCPSGALVPILKNHQTPVLLWPVQSMFALEPENYDANTIRLNHGVHAVQDLANVLKRRGKAFGVTHGHLRQDDFLENLRYWAQAGRALCSMRQANPLQVGGHFEDMLDLQIGDDNFLREMGLSPKTITLDEFSTLLKNTDEQKIQKYIQDYKKTFDIADNVKQALLSKTARGQAVLSDILERENSCACGLNFLQLCNDYRIADGLHVAASMFMGQGGGYAGEGDWVTATFVYGMQRAFGVASFSEMFSVGYADNRLVLRHWGEGNIAMARSRPKLLRSQLKDAVDAEFAIVDFEFTKGESTLINLNSTAQEQGQLISILGEITDDSLPKITGPRAVFKPCAADVRELLTTYAYNGGSHHLGLVKGDCRKVLRCLSRLSGWSYISL